MSNYFADGNFWIAYDDEVTFDLRRAWASMRCLRGVMIWAVDMIEKV